MGRNGRFTLLCPSLMETNPLGFITSLLFVLVPALFLVILYIQTNKPQT